MTENVRIIEKNNMSLEDIKYRFVEICSKCPLAMSLAVPTDQPIKLFLKPKKIYLAEKCNIIEEYALRSIVKWAIDK